MIKRAFPLFTIILLGVLWHLTSQLSLAEQSFGIAPLHSSRSPKTTLSPDTRPLLNTTQQEAYLTELEGSIPNWLELHDQPGEEHGERLFDYNRSRDEVREGHPLLQQRIAFLWSGILRRFNAEHRGFWVAIGPEFTPTQWGVLRFKPMGLPNEMIAVPNPDSLEILKEKVKSEDSVEIDILFSGRLQADESIMYSFSHENPQQGMVLPFVQIDRIQYFLKEN